MESLPEDIQCFMDQHIDSIEQLEILRVLGQRPAEDWSATTLSREVQIKADAIAQHLQTLQSRGLLSSAVCDQEVRWGYAPRTPELDDGVRRLLQCYRERPVTMIRMVYAKAHEVLRTLADAFRRSRRLQPKTPADDLP